MATANVNTEMNVVRTIGALRARVDGWRKNGETIGFAPTMGGLHAGHLSLVETSRKAADRTVASIFVNPKQFAPGEDLATYPRTEARDLAMLKEAGCDLVYMPAPAEMYPDRFQTAVTVQDLSQNLCGRSRPHFFGGVATVVCKLLNQCRPDFAVFGEKDFQQLLIIRRMVRDLDMGVEIISAPIVREADGLAMSSRNAYLSDDERRIAGKLNKIIARAAGAIEAGGAVDAALKEARDALASAGFENIDYLEVRAADDLALLGPGSIDRPARLFAAAILGATRLIDNQPIYAGQNSVAPPGPPQNETPARG